MAENDHTALARGTNLAISKKFSVEVARFIRGKDVATAKKLLEGVIAKKVAVPFTRHNRDQAHKRGRIAAGRYPVKTAEVFLGLLKSVEMNASNKGLDVDRLYVQTVVANKGTGSMRFGRHRGRETKRTHLDLIVEEREKKQVKKKAEPKKEEKKSAPAKEEKKEAPVKKEAPKEKTLALETPVKKEETKQ